MESPAVPEDPYKKRCIYSVSMRVFHDMYEIFCSKYLGGDQFFEDMDEYDPPSPENGMMDLKTRYFKWAAENNITIPNNGDGLRKH